MEYNVWHVQHFSYDNMLTVDDQHKIYSVELPAMCLNGLFLKDIIQVLMGAFAWKQNIFRTAKVSNHQTFHFCFANVLEAWLLPV